MNEKGIKKYIIFSMILTVIIGSPYPQAAIIHQNSNYQTTYIQDDSCYAYIIPLPHYEQITDTPNLQYATMNLINDLLRLHIPVYWLDQNIQLPVKNIKNQDEREVLDFQPGAFIVPFTNDSIVNKKIIVMMDDYCLNHEIYTSMETITIYALNEPFYIANSYELDEPNAAYYYGDGVYSSSMNWYVSTLSEAGFLNNEYLGDEDIIEHLSTDEYNIFIWPGGDLLFGGGENDVSLATRFLSLQVVKNFVANGGGYLGSCYGSYAASSGLRFFPFSILRYYLPKIPSYLYLGIQDSYTAVAISATINVSIDDTSHPVTYGSIPVLSGSELLGGCVYTKLGKNTESLGTVKDVTSTVWFRWFSDLLGSDSKIAKTIIDTWVQFTTGKSVWTTSNYEKGKVVAFGDHPEAATIHHKRIVHNAMYYVSTKELTNIQIGNSMSWSDIEVIRNKSKNITIPSYTTGLFSDVKSTINTTIDDLYTIEYDTLLLFNKTNRLIAEDKIDLTFFFTLLFGSGMFEVIQTTNRAISYLNGSIDEKYQQEFLNTMMDLNEILTLKNISFGFNAEMVQRLFNLFAMKNNTIHILNQIEMVDSLFSEMNISIENQITDMKANVLEKLGEINELFLKIHANYSSIQYELDHYVSNSEQNESIIEMCQVLKRESKNIEKKYPQIYFEAIKTLRDIWYLYEAIL